MGSHLASGALSQGSLSPQEPSHKKRFKAKLHDGKLWWPIHVPRLRLGRGPWTCDVSLQSAAGPGQTNFRLNRVHNRHAHWSLPHKHCT